MSPRSDTAAPPRAEPPPRAAAAPTRSSRAPRRAFALVVGLLVVALVVLLSQDGRRLSGSNNVHDRFTNVELHGGEEGCERRETVPAGTAAVRLTLDAGSATEPGTALTMAIRDRAGAVVSRGSAPAGWTGGRIDVPVREVRSTLVDAQVCITPAETVGLRGYSTFDPADGMTVDGVPRPPETMRISYLRGGEETWWALIPSIAHRMGLARGEVFEGPWMFLAWAGLLLALGALAAVGVARWSSAGRSLRGGWACALVALASGTAWALVTPAWHVPDEVAHFAYVQHLAETGRLPIENGETAYAPEEEQALNATQFYLVVGDLDARPPWTQAQDDAMDAQPPAARVGSGTAQSASNNPPLYYGLEALPYRAGTALDLHLLDRLMLMRLLSVLCAALTALAVFLFLREVLPSTPWAWTAGGLVAALLPLFGFISAGVQGDALLYTAGAGLLLALARAFRRGLTPARGAAIGAVLAIGLMTKLTFLGLAPGAALAVLYLARRDRAWRGMLVAGVIPGVVVFAYALANVLVWDRPLLAGGTGVPTPPDGGPAPSLDPVGGLSYIWQLYLPRLPGMADQFPAGDPMPALWLHGIIGRFGWLDTTWPLVVYQAARWVLVAVVALALVELVRAARRGDLRGRWAELASYAAVAGGLLLLIGWAGYRAHVMGAPGFEQARYLLPLLPLYAAAVALAARFWGPRRGPVVAAVLVGLALAHDVLAQLLVVSRFHG